MCPLLPCTRSIFSVKVPFAPLARTAWQSKVLPTLAYTPLGQSTDFGAPRFALASPSPTSFTSLCWLMVFVPHPASTTEDPRRTRPIIRFTGGSLCARPQLVRRPDIHPPAALSARGSSEMTSEAITPSVPISRAASLPAAPCTNTPAQAA